MSPRQAAPPRYISGHCGIYAHDRCRGVYAGADCSCSCHQLLDVPEPEPAPRICGECGRPLEEVPSLG